MPTARADSTPLLHAPQLQRRLSVGICVNVLAIAFEAIAVATAMPAAARELGGLPYYAWAFSLFVVGMLVATVVAGRLADRIGPVKPLLAGMAVFLGGLVLAGTAGQMVQLVAGRLVQGVGSGLINTALFVCVSLAYAPAQRPRVFSMISAAWVLPSLVGPTVAAWLTQRWSWHWVFFAVIPLVLFGAGAAWQTLRAIQRAYVRPEPDPDGARPAPLWAAGAVAVGAAAVQWAGQRLDWVSLLPATLGLALLVVGLPRLMPACFSRLGRGLPAVIITRGLFAGAFVGAEAFVPLMLVESRQVSLLLSGTVLTVGALGWAAGAWLQSRRWLRLRRDQLITLGCASLAVGVLGGALVAGFPALPYELVGVAWVFSGLGMGLATSSTSLATMTMSLPAEQGRNASSLNLCDALGAALFVGIAGTIFAGLQDTVRSSATFATVLAVMGITALLAVLSSLRIGAVNNEFADSGA